MTKLVEKSRKPPDNQIFTVSEFTRRVRTLLEREMPEVWVRGEISNFRRQSSGHCYFSLKDAGSQLSTVLFKSNASQTSLALRDGLQVIAFGRVTVYEPRGNYQLIVHYIIEDGLGRLQQDFERLKDKLSQEGLFDSERKRPLPLLPAVIGFVTSPTGAALRDFISILRRRGWRGRLVVLPAKVQGAGAAEEIAAMVVNACKLGFIELLVIGRGGGSLEDIWPFNEEIVVRAVADCSIPVISAVGHEIDFTLSDLAADCRAETPSAAAELISSLYLKCVERCRSFDKALDERASALLERCSSEIALRESHLLRLSPINSIEQHNLRIDDMANRLQATIRQSISSGLNRIQDLAERVASISPEGRIRLEGVKLKAMSEHYNRLFETLPEQPAIKIGNLSKRLRNASSAQILKRGFVLVRDEQGDFISRKKNIVKRQKLRAEFHDGEIDVEVKET